MKHKTPQTYYVPDLNIEIKVAPLHYKTYVAHFPGGAERVTLSDMKFGSWENRGPWEERDENAQS